MKKFDAFGIRKKSSAAFFVATDCCDEGKPDGFETAELLKDVILFDSPETVDSNLEQLDAEVSCLLNGADVF